MGRITMFTAEGCPHSTRVRVALRQARIPTWTEINISAHPSKRTDMVQLSGRISTPQVFFNTRYVGGADETVALLEKWECDKTRARSALERFRKEIDAFPDPQNPKFSVPETRTDGTKRSWVREPKTTVHVQYPDRRLSSVRETLEWLKLTLNRTKNKLPGSGLKSKFHWLSFEGKDAILAIAKALEIDEECSLKFLQTQLLDQQLICLPLDSKEKNDSTIFSPKRVYCLSCDQRPDVLNSYFPWKGNSCDDPLALVRYLKRVLNNLEGTHMGDDGLVDYVACKSDPLFTVLQEASCEVQVVDLALMDQKTKFAFAINLYNFMIKMAFIQVGTAQTDMARYSFYNSVKFNVGGLIYSFQDWENGIMRRNRKAPYAMGLQFKKDDPRLKLMCEDVRPEIHFGLNCGARSCPPINEYTAEILDKELKLVALAFFENDEHIIIDEDKMELKLSQIFKWYIVDFVKSGKKSDLPEYVYQHLHGVQQQKLERMMQASKNLKVVFMPYDWSVHSKKALRYDGKSLNPSNQAVEKVLSNKQNNILSEKSEVGSEDFLADNDAYEEVSRYTQEVGGK